MCKPTRLLQALSSSWKGSCALVQPVLPFSVIPLQSSLGEQVTKHSRSRQHRSVLPGSFDTGVYLDPIRVPSGVPDKYKARNPVTAGFKLLFPYITINKNVD